MEPFILVKLSVSGVACRAEKGLFVGVFVAGLKQGQEFSTIEYSEFTGVVFQYSLTCQSFQSTVESVALHAEERAQIAAPEFCVRAEIQYAIRWATSAVVRDIRPPMPF